MVSYDGSESTENVFGESTADLPWRFAIVQDAVDAAAPGDEVVVTNGVYSTGGRALAAYPLMTNRVCVDRAITLRLKQALELVEVRLLDHIVVGADGTASLALRGWV